MKIAVIGIMMVIGCSCHKVIDKPAPGRSEDAMQHQEEIRNIIAEYFHLRFDAIRGPLTAKEVREGSIRADHGPDWRQFKAKLKQGDGLYFCRSDRQSWAEQRGWEGYVAVRGSTVVGILTTVMN